MEELVNWINASTPVDASFAGKKVDLIKTLVDVISWLLLSL